MNNNSSALDALKQDPQAAALMKDQAALKRLLSAPETRQLMELLRKNGGDLKQAAQAAAQGRPQALQALLDQVTADPQGAKAMEQLQKKTRGTI